MAINLLPTEQKLKLKKQKLASNTQNIEMTEAYKLDKNKPGIKKTGVLSFFKQVVERPKEEKVDVIEEQKAKPMPEKKVILKQKITYKNIFGLNKPKVEYHVPERKPASLQQKSGLGDKIPFVFNKEKKPEPKIVFSTTHADADKEQFPKYKSISAEKVLKPEHVKMKKTKVIEVGTTEQDREKKLSTWQRFKNWLSGLIIKPKKPAEEFKDPDKISKLGGFPKPTDGPIIAVEEKEIIDKKKSDFDYASKIKDIDSQIGQPHEPEKKGALISYATPIELEEEIKEIKKEPKKEDKPLFVPEELKYDHQATKQEKLVASNFIEEKSNIRIDKVIKEEEAKKQAIKKHPSLINKFFAWLSGLFKQHKKIEDKYKATDEIEKSLIKKEGKETKVQAERVLEQPEKSQPLKKEMDKPEGLKEEKISFIPPPVSKIPSAPAPKPEKIEDNLHNVPLPPPAQEIPKPDITKDIPVPSAPLAADQDDKKDSKTMIKPQGFNGDQVNWEVNLIPEEAQEKEIPVSKILVLVMSVIISIGLVFGGWLWANYYYNTISVTISEVDAEIANIQSEIARFENLQDDAKNLQQKIENVDLLLEKHIYWSEFFNKLEFYTLAEVYYENMTADVNGTIILTAVSDTYENSIKQLYVFNEADDFVTDVTISGITKNGTTAGVIAGEEINDSQLSNSNETVRFNVNLTINPALFYYLN